MKQIKTIADLTPDAKNANKGTERGRKLIEKSLRRFGAGRSIVVDRNGTIIGGNKTTEAAADIGIEDIITVQSDGTKLVVVQRTDLDLDAMPEARAMAIADNRTSEIGLEWDATILDELVKADDTLLSDFFDKKELAVILAGLDTLPEEQDDPQRAINHADELREKYGVKPGQLWQLGQHRLACGDCMDIEIWCKLTQDRLGDIVITDPPYGINIGTDNFTRSGTKNNHTKKSLSKTYHPVQGDDSDYDPSRPMGLLHHINEQYWFGADYYCDKIPDRNKGAWLVWDKCENESVDSSSFDTAFGSSFELLWSKQPHKRSIIRFRYKSLFGTEQQDIQTRLHPTQKPLQVIEWILERYSKPEALCLDLYLGSGSTLIACERLKRVCYGTEIDPSYCAVILDRYERLTGITPVLCDHIGGEHAK